MITNMRSSEEMKEAKLLWELTVGKKSLHSTLPIRIAPIVRKAVDASRTIMPNKRDEHSATVVTVAKFISNIEPSYLNSDGKEISLPMVRGTVNLSKEDFDIVFEKFYEVIKSFILVSKTAEVTEIKARRLSVVTTLSKKALIKRAMMHLIYGSELFVSVDDYDLVKSCSALLDSHVIQDYIILSAVADHLGYESIYPFMDDACLTFIDQTDNVRNTGSVKFYNFGSISEVIL